MELIMYPTSGLPVALTGDLSEEGMQGGEKESHTIVDFPPLVDGDSVEGRDYGNRQNTLAFAIERTWPTPGDAAAYWMDHEELVPVTGALRMRATETNGDVIKERWLNGAAIISISGNFDGCGTKFQYRVGGGRITTERL